ncbi:MAG TPA: GAF domain-containing SpoIIE family protein phosphatase [Pseudonocardiaceae bacterium]|nr:GAF domain-containing SpoIIE family protein phosphatase [Pseudonocardiaceae bacterium]
MAEHDGAADRLRRIEAVTDAALAHLNTEQLLTELLGRVRELLRADTATVLLLDPSGRQLVATAAVGIEEEVSQGVRIPVGRGFAGRVAVERAPVMVDQVDNTTVANPLLWERGLRVLLGVPLLAGGTLIGVLHVGTVAARPFTDDDIHLLQLVADRIALAAHTEVSVAERAAAAALQRSLLPTVLPELPGLEFAARYVPGTDTGVGGDWYDVFSLPGGRVGIVMGDVVGHGLPAAVIMGRLRSALRAYALDAVDPAEVLNKLHRKATYFEHNAIATVSYAVVDERRTQVTLALAGHLPPILARTDASSGLITSSVGPPIGFRTAPQHHTSVVVGLPPGGLLCFYTDGLVERRDSSIDVGLERLRLAVTAADPETVCARVMAALVGNLAARDDIAVLAMRRDPDAVSQEPARADSASKPLAAPASAPPVPS